MRTRWSAYAGVSVALAGGVIVKAMAQRPNFYSAAVYLAQSNANLMILTNMIFVVACSMLLGLQKLLYGPLRPIEIEQLYEKAWFAVTETCLAMTIFRGEIGGWFLVMFFALLAGKVWAWIGEGRVETLEQQPPRNPRLFHTRLALSLGVSVLFNLSMLEYIIYEVMSMPKPDMMVMFGFEFAVLSIVSLSTAARYVVNLSEIAIVRKQKTRRMEEIRKERVEAAIRNVMDSSLPDPSVPVETGGENEAAQPTETVIAAAAAARVAEHQPIDEADVEVEGWEGKGRWMFYLDLMTDFCKLVVYLSFFFILLIFYGLPIHILRDVFMTCRSFFKRIADFLRYRNATRDMNERYPDANEQDIGREDVCIICREEMRPYQPAAPGQQTNPVAERMRPKKLPCGHVLHFSCLRSWLERQQICPTCRTSVTPANPAGQPPAVANGQAPADQHPPAADGGRGRAGVVRLGPLRIAFGAARGNNMLGDLQNQLRGGEPAQPVQPAANANGPQQYGFGIRWEGMRRRERSRGHRTVQDQLDAAERQIQQELNSIGGSLAELQVLRNMEVELARLRAQRSTTAAAQAPSIQRPISALPVNGTFTQTQLTGNSAARLEAGHPDLPAGLTLPEGWTMMPLTQAQGVPHPPMPLPPQAMLNNPAAGPLFGNLARGPNVGGPFSTLPAGFTGFPFQPPHQAGEHVNQAGGQAPSATAPAAVGPSGSSNNVSQSQTSHPRQADVNASSLADSSVLNTTHATTAPTTRTGISNDVSAANISTGSTLPVWGSAAEDILTNRAPVAEPADRRANDSDAEADNPSSSSPESSNSSAGRASTSSSSSDSSSQSKRRNPTVEDSADDPD